MTKCILLSTLLMLNPLASAFDLEEEIKNGTEHLTKELQKADIVKAEFNPFNREVSEEIRPKPGEFWMAVIGDSSTTGAAASPDFEPNWLNLLGHAAKALENLHGRDLGPGPGVPSPFRVMYSQAEFDAAEQEGSALELKIESDLSQKIDTEEFSFGYALAQKLNLSPNKLVLAGQDGVKVSSLPHQLDRVIQIGAGTLPPLIVVSYVANDLCHPDNFVHPVERFAQSYEADLRAGFEKLAQMPADPNGTRVVFMAPLDVANVLTNEQLLQQRVRFEGGDVSCQQLREGAVGGGDLGNMMSDTLVGACRGVLSSAGGDPQARLTQLRALQDAQNAVIQKIIGEYNSQPKPIKAEFAASTKAIPFQVGDLANDCFHPSAAGAARIADQLLTHELANLRR